MNLSPVGNSLPTPDLSVLYSKSSLSAFSNGTNRSIGGFAISRLAQGVLALAFALPTSGPAQTSTNLHSFTPLNPLFANQDGAYPAASLVLAQDTLFGTASQGGDAARGTVFKVKTDGTGFFVVHTFSAGDPSSSANSDGAFPLAGLFLSSSALYGTASAGGSAANGTAFKVNIDGSGFVTLHDFSATDPITGANTDGAAPWASLLLTNNTLYGTATRGGASDSGTIFKLNTDGTGFTTLHNFSALDAAGVTNGDGAYPLGGLVISGITIYGTTYRGGANGNGTVFKINTDGTGFSVLHDNDGGSRAGLALRNTTLYGTTESGGSRGGGTVFKIGIDGSGFTNLQNFAGSAGDGPWSGLVLVSNVLYGTTYSGGASALGSLFRINLDGTGFEELYSFAAAGDGTHPQAAPLIADGQIYGTASEGGDAGDGTVFKLSASPSNTAQLSIALAGPSVVLSWPVGATNSILQSATSLGSQAFWMNVTQTPTVIGGMNFLTNPISDTLRFYRLAQ